MGSRVHLIRIIFTHQVLDGSVEYLLIAPAAKELWGEAHVKGDVDPGQNLLTLQHPNTV